MEKETHYFRVESIVRMEIPKGMDPQEVLDYMDVDINSAELHVEIETETMSLELTDSNGLELD